MSFSECHGFDGLSCRYNVAQRQYLPNFTWRGMALDYAYRPEANLAAGHVFSLDVQFEPWWNVEGES